MSQPTESANGANKRTRQCKQNGASSASENDEIQSSNRGSTARHGQPDIANHCEHIFRTHRQHSAHCGFAAAKLSALLGGPIRGQARILSVFTRRIDTESDCSCSALCKFPVGFHQKLSGEFPVGSPGSQVHWLLNYFRSFLNWINWICTLCILESDRITRTRISLKAIHRHNENGSLSDRPKWLLSGSSLPISWRFLHSIVARS